MRGCLVRGVNRIGSAHGEGDGELLRLLTELESDHVERKESARTVKDRICQAICAFANDLPDHGTSGVIFVGATDDGRPAGLTVDDRLLLELAGGPYEVVTVENFGQPGVTDYRNPVLAEAMGSLGYVQKFGAGLPIARRALADNGNPPPEFTPDPAYVGVVVRRAVR